ncbi:unnamed protein product [Trifolium pratense]|uniref:Uncharacterized protein n=1 Tax=Trifolium pratense TaxID=57577 RepID=A0ACB0INZ0_TRIPR|nr:unnamed protein product [Trifolium pratense]
MDEDLGMGSAFASPGNKQDQSRPSATEQEPFAIEHQTNYGGRVRRGLPAETVEGERERSGTVEGERKELQIHLFFIYFNLNDTCPIFICCAQF